MKRALIILASAIAIFGLLGPSPATAAQDFNVGDRVEIDALGIGVWEPGVVIAENDQTYLVRADPLRPGMPYAEYTIPKTGPWVDRIRPSNAPLPDSQKPDKRKPTGILDCPITAGISGKNLSYPTAKKMIRCLSEYYEGDDYASRVDIKQFKVGKPRKWQPYNDIGPGTIDTLVYPIKVTANQIWWNSTTTEERKWLRIFNCFYSTLDEWTCGLGERIKDWPLVTRPRG